MKRVGIILRKNKSITDKDIYSVNDDLIKFLNKYEINLIFHIIDYNNLNNTISFINECDGIILPGGDAFNFKIIPVIKYLIINNKPTLGICLGMQEIAVACNGKLEKITNHNHHSNNVYVHEVIIDDNSLLYKILNKKRITVNSRHYDKVSITNAKRVAYSKDYIIEAIEIPNKKFFLGIQWHPESLYFDDNSNKIFDYFINKL